MFRTKAHGSWPIRTRQLPQHRNALRHFSKAGADGDYVYIRMNNITDDGILDLTDTKRITLKAASARKMPPSAMATWLLIEPTALIRLGKLAFFISQRPWLLLGTSCA